MILDRCAAGVRRGDPVDVAHEVVVRVLGELKRGRRYRVPFRVVVHQVITWKIKEHFGAAKATEVELEDWIHEASTDGTRPLEELCACDDSGADERARICRERAAEMLASALAYGDVASENPVVHGVRADLLRRAGRWEDAIAACAAGEAGIDPEDETHGHAAAVLAFIRELAEAEEDEVHDAAEAFAAGK